MCIGLYVPFTHETSLYCSVAKPTEHKDTSMERKDQQETTLVQETTVEYVETWESYESDEDSVTE